VQVPQTCPTCAAPLIAGAAFCPSCGTRLVGVAPTTDEPPNPFAASDALAASIAAARGAPPPNGPGGPTRKNLVIVAWIVGSIIAIITIGALINGKTGGGAGSGAHSIRYEVTGSASSVSVTYQNEQGGTSQQAAVPIPFSYSFTANAGAFLYISAQNQGADGAETCTIYIDGVAVKSGTSSGAYTICQASGTAS
jgi:crotonobetainyl-CoA:carnitine CoA-transferase CaiB-like acyl-CoA transferase